MSTVFSIQNLKLTYANKCILDDINLEISEGQMVTVIGENGSGKTTLLNTLVGLTPVQKGTVSLHGKPIQTYETHLLAQQISSLGQSDIRIDDMPVWSRISQGFIPNRGPAFVPGPKETAWIQNIAERLKIADCLDLTLGQLSGGERRRVHLARALVNPSPQIIILDEPFANIDIGHQTLITTILRERESSRLHRYLRCTTTSLGGRIRGTRIRTQKRSEDYCGPTRKSAYRT